MTTRVAFLRAVNLGARKAKNTDLMAVIRDLGYDDVWTHINSGNVVFSGTGTRSVLEQELGEAFEKKLGFETTTFVRSAAELRDALALGPFPLAAGDTYFITFLKDTPKATQAGELEALSNDFDTLVVDGRDVHWRMRGRSVDTKLVAKQWAAIVGDKRTTSRNTNMLRKLVAKIDARG